MTNSSEELRSPKAAAEDGIKSLSHSVSKSPVVSARPKVPGRQAIALISAHGDPAAELGKEEAGGQNIYVRRVGEALAKLGWQVDMFTRKTRAEDPEIVEHSPYCRTIRLVAGPEEFVPRDQLFQYLPEFAQTFQKFQSKAGSHYPLVHTNYWISAWVGMRLREASNIQLIHTYHSLGAVKYQSIAQVPAIAETRLSVEQEILEQANCIVATSPQEQDTLRQLVSQKGNIEVIPCGTDIENFHSIPKAEARARLGLSPNEAIVLYVGRLDPRKGIDTLVRACALLKDEGEKNGAASSGSQTVIPRSALRLVIVGGSDPDHIDGIERERIKQIVEQEGIADRTLFTGQVGHDLLPLYYTAADVCVIPSDYEPFGLVAIEAMACGTPVVASDVGGLKFTVIPEETGILVPPHDPVGFAQAIERILTDEIWTMKLRRQASARVQQNFSWSEVAARLSNLYRRLLAQSITHELLWETPAVANPALESPVVIEPAEIAEPAATQTVLTSPLTKVS
ncbi:MAG: glycosyltransferase family 1 protein [Scytolyngbya sp. HA4215-MV1]|nr:glycosyltransferase family 1 protein [Scytolyngbya sp. HA4215-MV1]